MFFWNSLAFSMIQQMLAIWSLVPLPFLRPAWTSGSSWFTYCWSLAWRILSMVEPGRLQSMGSLRVGHDWATELNWTVTQMVKNLPAMWETWVQCLGQEDPLQMGMATHSSILTWSIPWIGEPGGLQSMESQRVGPDWVQSTSMIITNLHLHLVKLVFLFLFPRWGNWSLAEWLISK